MRLTLLRKKKQTGNSWYDWPSHANNYIRNQYKVTLRNKFDTELDKTVRYTPNNEYKNFITTRLEAADECIHQTKSLI